MDMVMDSFYGPACLGCDLVLRALPRDRCDADSPLAGCSSGMTFSRVGNGHITNLGTLPSLPSRHSLRLSLPLDDWSAREYVFRCGMSALCFLTTGALLVSIRILGHSLTYHVA